MHRLPLPSEERDIQLPGENHDQHVAALQLHLESLEAQLEAERQYSFDPLSAIHYSQIAPVFMMMSQNQNAALATLCSFIAIYALGISNALDQAIVRLETEEPRLRAEINATRQELAELGIDEYNI